MRKDILWTLSMGFTFLFWLFLPELRIVFSIFLAIHVFILYLGIRDLRFNFFCKALCYQKNAPKKLSITFDDGPDPECTPDVLDLLDKYKFKATFFLIAEKAQQHSHICKEIILRGHTIGCHDLNHSYLCNLRMTKKMIAEIGLAQNILHSITGLNVRFYRPPVGLSNPHLPVALKKLGMLCIGWNKSTKDAGNRNLKSFSRFKTLPDNGAVLLLHDCMPIPEYKEAFFTELENLFKTIKENKFEVLTIDKLFSEKPYLESVISM